MEVKKTAPNRFVFSIFRPKFQGSGAFARYVLHCPFSLRHCPKQIRRIQNHWRRQLKRLRRLGIIGGSRLSYHYNCRPSGVPVFPMSMFCQHRSLCPFCHARESNRLFRSVYFNLFRKAQGFENANIMEKYLELFPFVALETFKSRPGLRLDGDAVGVHRFIREQRKKSLKFCKIFKPYFMFTRIELVPDDHGLWQVVFRRFWAIEKDARVPLGISSRSIHERPSKRKFWALAREFFDYPFWMLRARQIDRLVEWLQFHKEHPKRWFRSFYSFERPKRVPRLPVGIDGSQPKWETDQALMRGTS